MARVSKPKDWNMALINYDELVRVIGQRMLNSDIVHGYTTHKIIRANNQNR